MIPISTVSLAMCEGARSGRAGGGRGYNHLQMGEREGGRKQKAQGGGSRTGDIWRPGERLRYRSGGRDRRETQAELFGGPQCCSTSPGAQLGENKEALAGWRGHH